MWARLLVSFHLKRIETLNNRIILPMLFCVYFLWSDLLRNYDHYIGFQLYSF